MFFLQATEELETTSQYYADLICPVLLETIIKGSFWSDFLKSEILIYYLSFLVFQ